MGTLARNFWDGSTFWDGAGGAIIGSLISLAIALFVLYRTRTNDQQNAQHDRSLDMATAILEPAETWQEDIREAHVAVTLGVKHLDSPEIYGAAEFDKNLSRVRAIHALCDDIRTHVRSRAIQIDDQSIQVRLPLVANFVTMAGIDLFTLLHDGTPQPQIIYRHEVESALEAAGKHVAEIKRLVTDYLTVRP